MITYGIYNIIKRPGINLSQAFLQIITDSNNELDNFYYPTIKEAMNHYKPKPDNKEVNTFMYKKDTSLSFPYTYRIIPKTEIFSDFPICKILKDN
jgi:hypothetical protein